MDRKTTESLARKLRKEREVILKEVADTRADLDSLTDTREIELEERAADDRAARLLAKLDERGRREIEEIDAALARIADGIYGRCATCGKNIPLARLKALPATRHCLDCARRREAAATPAPEVEVPTRGDIPAEMTLLSDREIEATLRERMQDDPRIDREELRIVCRHGVVYLDGALPSEGERQILLKLVTDVLGLPEVVDRLQVKECLWEREDRSREERPRLPLPWAEEPVTEDVVESIEDGVEYVPPVAPLPDPEKES